jgi:hypothetical protein
MMSESATRNARAHRQLLSRRWSSSIFDRVNVLGDDTSYGHSGCVNALSWARDGELLLVGSFRKERTCLTAFGRVGETIERWNRRPASCSSVLIPYFIQSANLEDGSHSRRRLSICMPIYHSNWSFSKHLQHRNAALFVQYVWPFRHVLCSS